MEGGYDLLLLDSMLPGIDGLTLLAALGKSKQTPVLMLTVRVHGDDRVRGRQGGVDDDLSKLHCGLPNSGHSHLSANGLERERLAKYVQLSKMTFTAATFFAASGLLILLKELFGLSF